MGHEWKLERKKNGRKGVKKKKNEGKGSKIDKGEYSKEVWIG